MFLLFFMTMINQRIISGDVLTMFLRPDSVEEERLMEGPPKSGTWTSLRLSWVDIVNFVIIMIINHLDGGFSQERDLW